tara:strand:- start:9137 stop:9346 length:210 start_codon:yes stop_codon:yes gene_type:complete
MLCLFSDDPIFKNGDKGMTFPERAFIQTISRTDGTVQWHTVRTMPPSELIPIFLDYYARSDQTAMHSAA